MDKRMLVFATALVLAAPAPADVTLRTVTEKDGKPYTVIYISGGKVRSENLQITPSFFLWQTGAHPAQIMG